MAEKNDGVGSSRLSEMSEQFYTCSMIMNSCRYLPENQYGDAHPDIISDGDCRGRDLDLEGANTIGTNKDIFERDCMLGKNSDLYTHTKPYGEGNC